MQILNRQNHILVIARMDLKPLIKLLVVAMSFCKFQDCDRYCEGSTDYCASHNLFLRKQLRESLKPKKIYVLHKSDKPIAKVSKKMAKELKVYSVKRAEHLKEHPDCQIRLMNICQNDRETNQVHHSAKRVENLTKKETFLTACLHCHRYIEDVMSASERRERGFLK